MDLLNTFYIIFDVSELYKVDFSYVKEDNANTVRKSINNIKTFVNWFGTTPPAFVNDLTTKSKIYSYSEILQILQNDEWFKRIDL
jgi:hypothetical protein